MPPRKKKKSKAQIEHELNAKGDALNKRGISQLEKSTRGMERLLNRVTDAPRTKTGDTGRVSRKLTRDPFPGGRKAALKQDRAFARLKKKSRPSTPDKKPDSTAVQARKTELQRREAMKEAVLRRRGESTVSSKNRGEVAAAVARKLQMLDKGRDPFKVTPKKRKRRKSDK